MKRILLIVAVFVLPAVASAVAYQAAARERDYRAMLGRGERALAEEQTFGAIEAYSGAIALRPDSMLAHLRRGETYQRRGELDEAARDFRTAAALDPTATRPLEALGDVLYQLQRFDRAADVYARFLRLDDRAAHVAYKLALARYRGGNVDGALGALSTSIRLDDRRADARYLLGLCLRDKHREPEAIRALEQAVTLAPSLIEAREELSELYAATGRRAEEVTELRALAEIDRDHVERRVALGLAQARAGTEELAIATLGAALGGVTSDQPLVYQALGQIWLGRAQAQGDAVYLSKALEALSRAAASPLATSETLTLYGRALLVAGQIDAAEQTLHQATTHYPLDPAALALYAGTAERQSHYDAARAALVDYAGIIVEDSERVTTASRIAALSLKLRDAQTAVLWLERAAALVPDDVRVLGDLADAQIRAGRADDARATIARALEKDPSNPALLALSRRVR